MRACITTARWQHRLVRTSNVHTTCAERNAVAARVTEKFLPFATPLISPCADQDASTKAAVRTIEERQELHEVPAMFALEKSRCRHGYPRAYVQLPVYHKAERCANLTKLDDMKAQGKEPVLNKRPKFSANSNAPIAQSCMIRLSCPHLTKAIDKFEYEGRGIERLNNGLNKADGDFEPEERIVTHNGKPKAPGPVTESAQMMRQHFQDINNTWRSIKSELMDDRQRQMVAQRLGEESIDHFMNSGISGISAGKENDVKCLHAHVADALLRGQDANKFGRWTLRKLEEEEGVDPTGCGNCWQQCDRKFKRTESSYWYVSNKNTQGLRQTKLNHRALIEQMRQKATAELLAAQQWAQDNARRGGKKGMFVDGEYVSNVGERSFKWDIAGDREDREEELEEELNLVRKWKESKSASKHRKDKEDR